MTSVPKASGWGRYLLQDCTLLKVFLLHLNGLKSNIIYMRLDNAHEVYLSSGPVERCKARNIRDEANRIIGSRGDSTDIRLAEVKATVVSLSSARCRCHDVFLLSMRCV